MKKGFPISVVPVASILAAIAIGHGSDALAGQNVSPNRFEGKYCGGVGDVAHLKLIDESFAFFHANSKVPNLTLVSYDRCTLG